MGAGFAPFAGEATLAWIEHTRRVHPGDPDAGNSCAMHDPLAVAVLTHPELVTFADAQVSIVTGDGKARGVMITDLLRSDAPPAANCQVAASVEVTSVRNRVARSPSACGCSRSCTGVCNTT